MFRKNYSVGSAQNLNINVFTRYVAFSMYWGGGGGVKVKCAMDFLPGWGACQAR